MKSPSVAELEPRQQITAVFLVQSKETRQKKTGEPYLSLTLIDRTGEIDAKMWDNVAEVMDTFDRDDFIRVKGETQLYQSKLQLTVHRISPVDARDVDLTDFLPASKRDIDEMFAELKSIIASIRNPHLKALLDAIFADRAIAEAYKRAPAAKTIHHAWLGGLLEHVLSLATLAKATATHYQGIDEDLLMTGVILHDIGKIHELSYGRSFGYTVEGSLLGHIQIAMRIIGDKINAVPGFPPKLRNLVEHLVLSHHGQLEFGSPKVPLFPEALLLHHLDNMDSKMELVRATLEREKSTPSVFTPYVQALDRPILDKEKYLAVSEPNDVQPASPPVAATAQSHPAAKPATVLGEKMQALQGLFAEGK